MNKLAITILSEGTKQVMESQAWRSVVRHEIADTPRNRTLYVLSNLCIGWAVLMLSTHLTRGWLT